MLRRLIIFLVSIICVGLIINYFFAPAATEVKIKSIYWTSTVEIQELRTVTKKGSYIPYDGRYVASGREVSHYIKEGKTRIPVYKTVYWYEIEEYSYSRSVFVKKKKGIKPYYGEVILAEGSGPYSVGKERESGRYIAYHIKDISGTVYECTEDVWNMCNKGDHVMLNLTRFNNTFSSIPNRT